MTSLKYAIVPHILHTSHPNLYDDTSPHTFGSQALSVVVDSMFLELPATPLAATSTTGSASANSWDSLSNFVKIQMLTVKVMPDPTAGSPTVSKVVIDVPPPNPRAS